MRTLLLILVVSINLILLGIAGAAKPNVWVYTDMSDPREGGHSFNDPDDIVTMSALLLEANRFNIETIVVSSTNRKYLGDSMDFVSRVFLDAGDQMVRGDSLKAGKYQLDLSELKSGDYKVQVRCGGITQYFELEKK